MIITPSISSTQRISLTITFLLGWMQVFFHLRNFVTIIAVMFFHHFVSPAATCATVRECASNMFEKNDVQYEFEKLDTERRSVELSAYFGRVEEKTTSGSTGD